MQIGEHNVTHLLEGGLLEKLKTVSEEKASRYRRILKKVLLKKYFDRKKEGSRRGEPV